MRKRSWGSVTVALSALVCQAGDIPSYVVQRSTSRCEDERWGRWARTRTSSVGLTFSLEGTIPEGGPEGERPSSTLSTTASRMKRPNVRSGLGTSTGGGARDLSVSSSLDLPTSSSRTRLTTIPLDDEIITPTSTASTLKIPMPANAA